MPDMFEVRAGSYSAGRLVVYVNGKRYEYEVSPYTAYRFKAMLCHNKGRAITILRGRET